MSKPLPNEIRTVFVDESSQNKHDFLVLGGVTCPAGNTEEFCNQIRLARMPDLPHSELKWTKVSNSKLPAYQRVVDSFFETKTAQFHSLTVPMKGRADAVFNNGDKEIGFNKEIYQLLMKFRRLYGGCVFHVYPDSRKTNASTEELRLILNRGAKKSGDNRDWPFRRVHFRHSHDEPLIQLADILSGAIAYHVNQHHLAPDASKSKTALASHIFQRAGISNPGKDTPMSGKFTIWHRQLKRVLQP